MFLSLQSGAPGRVHRLAHLAGPARDRIYSRFPAYALLSWPAATLACARNCLSGTRQHFQAAAPSGTCPGCYPAECRRTDEQCRRKAGCHNGDRSACQAVSPLSLSSIQDDAHATACPRTGMHRSLSQTWYQSIRDIRSRHASAERTYRLAYFSSHGSVPWS